MVNLDKRVDIQAPGASPDALGQPSTTWSTVMSVSANIRHESGASAIRSAGDVSIVRASIRVRYVAGIDAGMRVVFGSTVYDIRAVLADPRAPFMDLVCEVVNVES